MVTRSGRELIKGGLELDESVCSLSGFVFVFVYSVWLIRK